MARKHVNEKIQKSITAVVREVFHGEKVEHAPPTEIDTKKNMREIYSDSKKFMQHEADLQDQLDYPKGRR